MAKCIPLTLQSASKPKGVVSLAYYNLSIQEDRERMLIKLEEDNPHQGAGHTYLLTWDDKILMADWYNSLLNAKQVRGTCKFMLIAHKKMEIAYVRHFFENVAVAPWTSCAYCGHTIKLGYGAMCKCMNFFPELVLT